MTRRPLCRVASWRPAFLRPPRVPPLAVDCGLAVLAAAVGVLSVLASDTAQHRWGWWVYALAPATALPLPWRRRAPFGCLLMSAPFQVAISVAAHAAYPQVPVAALVLIYTVAERSGDGRRWFTLVTMTVSTLLTTYSPDGAIFSWLPLAAGYIVGSTVRELRRAGRAQAERLAAVEREAAAQAVRATVEERTRIAREMHDILAHAVSLMVVQAEAGPVAVRANPERAVAAFDAIADSGRDAMAQLRRMLGVLKEEGGSPRLAPNPTLDDLTAVVERVRRAGIPTRLRMTGIDTDRLPPLAPHVSVAAYRIVQEALTNVVKHSGAAGAEVRLDRTGSALEVVVSDDGRGAGAGSGWPGGRGRGLIGIRERAAACGGSATARAGPDGRGFVVTAYLPTDIDES